MDSRLSDKQHSGYDIKRPEGRRDVDKQVREAGMRYGAIRFTLIFLLTAVLAGCAARESAYDLLYAELTEEIGTPDPKLLEGRRIVIDPGHGGQFKGAIAPDSLSEAEVNLGVALYLWGMLEEAGAEVHLTRKMDRDFLPDSTAELRDDLAARTKLANSADPDIFLSIHHNSNIALDRSKNVVEVYYNGEDEGASLELATDIHTHLARNLGIPETTIKPGNYYVLRNSTAGAAVLGEASYISNPEVEDRLKLSAKQKLEAEAYYLGIVDYFSRGAPAIDLVAPETDTISAPGRLVFRIAGSAGIPFDPASVRVSIDGKRLDHHIHPLSGDLACDLPPDLPNGPHSISVSARSTRAGTATLGPLPIFLDRPMKFLLPMKPEVNKDGRIDLKILVLDSMGLPVAGGKKIVASSEDGGFSGMERTINGMAVFDVPAGGKYIISAGPAIEKLHVDLADPIGKILAVAVDKKSGIPVPDPQAVAEWADMSALGNNRGLIRSDSLWTGPFWIIAGGYRPEYVPGPAEDERSTTGIPPVILMEPSFEGILHERRVFIDPAGGGWMDAGRSDDGIRGAAVNLRIANELEKILTGAGALVSLSRKGEIPLSPQNRVSRANRSMPDVAISLRYGEIESCVVHHYPGSTRGEYLSSWLAGRLASLPPCPDIRIEESAEIFLQQTRCPAVVLSSASLQKTGAGDLMMSPRWISVQAQMLLLALIDYFGEGEYTPVSWTCKVLSGGDPVAGASITIDNSITIITGEDGTADFACLTEGSHSCSIIRPDGRYSFFRVEIKADGTFVIDD
jgi:N-acetylmuramoyl-L-alanine amidase